MTDMSVVSSRYDFQPMHEAMQRYVDGEILPGLSSALLVGNELVDVHCCGWSDREADIKLGPENIFRVFSNTKLVTSCAVLLLYEEGAFQLDDAIETYIPQLGQRRVLREGASDIADTVPADRSITIRHLMTHSSGLVYGLFDPESTMFKAYTDNQVNHPGKTLAEMIDALSPLPLSFQPGTGWEYSVATDVVARLVEVLSGTSFDRFIQDRIFDPLGMVDTGFVVPPDQQHRLTSLYEGADIYAPMQPGLSRLEDHPYPGAYLKPVPKKSGGGGLVSTLPDMVALLKRLVPGEATLLKSETLKLIHSNQLSQGLNVRFPMGEFPGRGYGLAGAVTLAPLPQESHHCVGEFQWGGLAGTHWWIHPDRKIAGALMTQRHIAFWHPYYFELKNLAYAALLG